MITVLCGGVGAARFLNGLCDVVEPTEITAVVNTGDDLEIHGLVVCPDLDTITYSLARANNVELGWGLTGESFTVLSALERYGGPTWFRLGDRDLATHLYRTGELRAGVPLSAVAEEIARAWGVGPRLLPMTDDPVRTRLLLTESGSEVAARSPDLCASRRRPDSRGSPAPSSQLEVSFQEYFVALGHGVEVAAVRFAGAESARPAPGVIEAIETAELVVVAPSNPVVSIDPILALPEIADAVRSHRHRVIGISPIVGGSALKGPADRLLRELGGEASALGVARWLGGFVATLVIDEVDRDLAPAIADLGVRPVVAETVMSTRERAALLASATLAASGLRSLGH